MSKKKEWEVNDTFLDVVIKGSSIVLIIVSIIVSVVSPFLLNLLKDKILILSEQNLFIITSFSAAITLIFAIVLYCIGTIKQFREIILRNNLTELNGLINQLKISSENIANNVNPVENLIMESYIIHDISKFYNKLIELRENVQDNRSIRLMNFASYPIQENNKHKDNNDSVQKYFGNELSFCENKPDASVYKIVSIHNEEKLDECRKLVNKAGKMNLRNFHLAFLNIKKFDNYLPDIIGVDIIGDMVLFTHPEYARITNKSDWAAIYMRSPEISKIFRNYYKTLWKEIENDTSEERGLILFDGENGGISPRIDDYWAKIEKQIKEDLKEQISSHVNDKNVHIDTGKKKNTSLLKYLMSFKKSKDKTNL